MALIELAKIHDSDTTVPYWINPKGEKEYIIPSDTLYTNSKCLFIEYVDVVKSPWFLLLSLAIKRPKIFDKILNVSMFRGYDTRSLAEWYIKRRDFNPFISLLKKDLKDKIDGYTLLRIIDEAIAKSEDLIEYSPILNIGKNLSNFEIGKGKIIEEVVVWYPFENPAIINDIISINESVKFMSGDLVEVLEKIPKDTTYIFADAANLDALYELGRLEMSSVLVADDYMYNYIENEETGEIEYKVDIDSYVSEVVCKITKFSANIDESSGNPEEVIGNDDETEND